MGDECDPLPHEYDISQLDSDGDGIGDTCDPFTDIDGDGYGDSGFSYACALDNCPGYYNPTQQDNYPLQGNGIGDACDCEGNFDCDSDTDGTDAATFKADFGRSPFSHPCIATDTCNGDFFM